MRLSLLFTAAALLSVSLVATSARADSITFDGRSGNAYNYGVNVTSDLLRFASGATLTFTGLADVTGASSLFGPDDVSSTFTPTSVTFTTDNQITFGGGNYNDFFTIDSTATAGTVAYSADTREGILSGALEGPAIATSVTPEPSSIALLGTGILVIAGLMRKRFA